MRACCGGCHDRRSVRSWRSQAVLPVRVAKELQAYLDRLRKRDEDFAPVPEVLWPVISHTLFAETQAASSALDVGSVEIRFHQISPDSRDIQCFEVEAVRSVLWSWAVSSELRCGSHRSESWDSCGGQVRDAADSWTCGFYSWCCDPVPVTEV